MPTTTLREWLALGASVLIVASFVTNWVLTW